MRFSETWLREWVDPALSTEELAQQLTMLGLEVDAVTPVAPEFTKVVVGEVLSAEPHPDADRLRVCEVDVGNEKLAIVCGGVNVRAGIKVPVAVVGANLPGDFKIKKSKLRGVVSNGMICSEKELGLGEGEPKSIMVLPTDAPVGVDLRQYLALDDHTIDVELTPNRSDCISICGIARELAVVGQLEVNHVSHEPVQATIDDKVTVTIAATEDCPRYVGRVIRNINTSAVTPIWLQERLRRSGIRAIHPVVDVTNYVMLELGQPMHAFDLAKLDGEITVRHANSNESIKVIDEQECELSATTLVIADNSGAQAIAGVMGGFASAVSATTTDIFLESAYFRPAAVRQAAKEHGFCTDSSYRFERGVDFELQTIAFERATALLLEITGGEAGPVTDVVDEDQLPTRSAIRLAAPEVKRLLGITIPVGDIERILTSLGMTMVEQDEAWLVTPPSYRFDINHSVDLIEELARVYGYAKIPTLPMNAYLQPLPINEELTSTLRLKQLFVDRGYHEVITYSFVDPKLQTALDPQAKPAVLANPISADLAVMRTSLWPGLVNTLQYNENRQIARVRLFEIGLSFGEKGQEQHQVLALAAIGSAYPEQWGRKRAEVDFFDVKADVEALLALNRNAKVFSWRSSSHPALHPGQTAGLYCEETLIGYLGVMHPSLVRQLGFNKAPVLFEALLAPLEQALLPDYQAISKFPAVRRDLSLVLDRTVPVADVVKIIQKSSAHMLNKVQIFDIYQGEGVEIDKKSVALGLTFQDPSRTLRDNEINDVIQNIINQLESEVNAKLRT